MQAEIKRFFDLNRMYTDVRTALMDILTDEDLQFQPSDASPKLGVLCKELGDTQHAYIESFKTYEVDFSYQHPDAELARDVEKLKAWYAQLDAELEAVLATITDEDVASKTIKRDGFELPPHIHLDIFREALLIFYGKVTIYLNEMGKPKPGLWEKWIG